MEVNRKRVLITGHQGFIGAWVAYEFYRLGWRVFGIDDQSSYGERLFDVAKISNYMEEEVIQDVADLDELKKWVEKCSPDLIVHLAGQAIVPRAFKQPTLTFKANTLGTCSIIEASKNCERVKALLCITSDKVYENSNSPMIFNESDPLGGNDIYSVSKSSAELLVKAFVNSHLKDRGLIIQTIRLGNVVGGGDWSVNRLLPDLVNSIENNSIFKIRYLNATRPFQHVTDVVSGILNIAMAALDGRLENGGAWNLGPKTNSFAKVEEVINLFKERWPNVKVGQESNLVKEDINLRVDVSKYSNTFRSPHYDSKQSLCLAMDWYDQYYQGQSALSLMDTNLDEMEKYYAFI
jgi:CDP-glucose 4,6-dehydratase